MDSFQKSQGVVYAARTWSIIATTISFVCAFFLNIMLKGINKNDWTVMAFALVSLIVGVSSIVAGVKFHLANKIRAEDYVFDYKEKHGEPLSFCIRVIDKTLIEWTKNWAVALSVVWCLGCLWSLLLACAQNEKNVDTFDKWFAIIAHSVNGVASVAFGVLLNRATESMKIIALGEQIPAAAARSESTSTSDGGSKTGERIEMQPRLRATAGFVPERRGDVDSRQRGQSTVRGSTEETVATIEHRVALNEQQ